MRASLVLLTALSACVAPAFAQEGGPVTLGFKIGVPVTDMFSASNTNMFGSIPSGASTLSASGSTFTSAVPRYEFGVSGEFHVTRRFRFEVDGLFKRGGFDSSSPFGSGIAYRPTTFNDWEIPGLFKTNISVGHFRPFVDFGAALRHISTITETTYGSGYSYGLTNDNSIALHNRNSVGGVAGIGFTFKKGPFELSPEVRYTRWANESFQANGLRTNLDQGDVLLGIAF